jgi:hypothetical protein
MAFDRIAAYGVYAGALVQLTPLNSTLAVVDPTTAVVAVLAMGDQGGLVVGKVDRRHWVASCFPFSHFPHTSFRSNVKKVCLVFSVGWDVFRDLFHTFRRLGFLSFFSRSRPMVREKARWGERSERRYKKKKYINNLYIFQLLTPRPTSLTNLCERRVKEVKEGSRFENQVGS